MRARPLSEHCRLRLSGCARIENFTWAVDETMKCFRRSGEIVAKAVRHEPVNLIFHPLFGRLTSVGVTKVSRPMSLVLEESEVGVGMDELLSSLSSARRPEMVAVLQKLVALRVLDVIG